MSPQMCVGQVSNRLAVLTLPFRYTTTIWCWHLSEQHHSLHTHSCQATLFVSPFYGAAIEGLITFISRIVALESEHWATSVSIGANSTATVLLVLFGKPATGHPV